MTLGSIPTRLLTSLKSPNRKALHLTQMLISIIAALLSASLAVWCLLASIYNEQLYPSRSRDGRDGEHQSQSRDSSDGGRVPWPFESPSRNYPKGLCSLTEQTDCRNLGDCDCAPRLEAGQFLTPSKQAKGPVEYLFVFDVTKSIEDNNVLLKWCHFDDKCFEIHEALHCAELKGICAWHHGPGKNGNCECETNLCIEKPSECSVLNFWKLMSVTMIREIRDTGNGSAINVACFAGGDYVDCKIGNQKPAGASPYHCEIKPPFTDGMDPYRECIGHISEIRIDGSQKRTELSELFGKIKTIRANMRTKPPLVVVLFTDSIQDSGISLKSPLTKKEREDIRSIKETLGSMVRENAAFRIITFDSEHGPRSIIPVLEEIKSRTARVEVSFTERGVDNSVTAFSETTDKALSFEYSKGTAEDSIVPSSIHFKNKTEIMLSLSCNGSDSPGSFRVQYWQEKPSGGDSAKVWTLTQGSPSPYMVVPADYYLTLKPARTTTRGFETCRIGFTRKSGPRRTYVAPIAFRQLASMEAFELVDGLVTVNRSLIPVFILLVAFYLYALWKAPQAGAMSSGDPESRTPRGPPDAGGGQQHPESDPQEGPERFGENCDVKE